MPGPTRYPRIPTRLDSNTHSVERLYLVGFRNLLRAHGIEQWDDALEKDVRDWMRLVGAGYRRAGLERRQHLAAVGRK